MIYVVMGTTGEYSDRSEWPVCAYHSESIAIRHADRATAWAAEFFKKAPRYNYRPGLEKTPSPWDPDITMDYTGTDYYVIPVAIREDLPEVES